MAYLVADQMTAILDGLSWICYASLCFYLFRATGLFLGRTTGDNYALRESMAAMYTLAAAYLIAMSVDAMHPFVESVGQSANFATTSPLVPIGVRMVAAVVFTAFVANCSRSLYVLKGLDHAYFEPVPRWDVLATYPTKRALEFSTRAIAAGLFISLEYQLKVVASGTTHMSSGVLMELEGRSPFVALDALILAGAFGMGLYIALLAWWMVGFWIARGEMPKKLLPFYASGFVSSAFVFFFANRIPTEDSSIALISCALVVAVAAAYMLILVLHEIADFAWQRLPSISKSTS